MSVLTIRVKNDAVIFNTFKTYHLLFAIFHNKTLQHFDFLNYQEFVESLFQLPTNKGFTSLKINKPPDLFVETNEIEAVVEFQISFKKSKYGEAFSTKTHINILKELKAHIHDANKEYELKLIE